jgi:DNA-binding HxlR family transcriptional regulator
MLGGEVTSMSLRLYGQYCPIARTSEILGDRWTPLILRELSLGVTGFNAMARGLPGVSRAILADRLKALERTGLVRREEGARPQAVAYNLTQAGTDFTSVLDAMAAWGFRWAFGEPRAEELDPWLLLWWMRRCSKPERLPRDGVSLQFDFTGDCPVTYWLLMETTEVTACLRPPRPENDLVVRADVAAVYKLLMGQLSMRRALGEGLLAADGPRRLIKGFFEDWFQWDYYYAYLPPAPGLAFPALEEAMTE